MPTAIATSRGWNARSSVSSESFAASPTDILEPAARMKEPSECPTPTQKLAPRPSRSQYVRNGTSNFSRASFPPGVTSSTDEVRGSSKSLGFPAQPERSSSPKAQHTGEADLLDEEMCLTSTPLSADHSRHSSCRDTSAKRVSGSTKSRTAVTISGTGSSSRRSGGRSNFFFGSKYAASKKLPTDSVKCGGKAAAGRVGTSPNRGGVLASTDQQARRGDKLEGEAGRTKALAVQDGQRKPNLSEGYGGNLRNDEVPPTFEPLGTDERRKLASHGKGMDKAREGEVRVAFPSEFDGGRKEANRVSKVQSRESLGSKSGSTSLDSMLSGSPRSAGTVHDTGLRSPSPRSPLPEVSTGSGEGAVVDKGNVLISAYPTPLSTFGGDMDLPSDHPTPLSTVGSSKGSVRKNSKSRPAGAASTVEKAMAPAAKATSTTAVAKSKRGNGAVTSGTTVVNPAASMFMHRMKYWGGGIAEASDARAPAAVASAASVTVAGADKRAHAKVHANSGPRPEVAIDAPSRENDVTLGAHQTTVAVKVGVPAVFACDKNAYMKKTPPEPERSPSYSTVESCATSSEIGVKVVPLDTVTSEAASVFASGQSQRQWRDKTPPPPLAPAQSYDRSTSSRPAELVALRSGSEIPASSVGSNEKAKGEVRQREVDQEQVSKEEDEESDMDWDVVSDEEEKKEVTAAREVLPPPPTLPAVVPENEHTESTPLYSARRTLKPASKSQSPPPPRYMAIVEAANVTSALDHHSSTSEHDTSPSEDDGNMMEILTDRLMEACHKIEEVTAIPAEELSDGGTSVRRRGGPGSVASSIRRRQLSTMSSRAFSRDQVQGSTHRHGHSTFFSSTSMVSAAAIEEKFDSDEEAVDGDGGAAARKLRRERVRRRTRAQSRRKMAGALTVPTDSKGDPIDVHTAAYSGDVDTVNAYVTQGGDVEIRDQFKATPLMLASERGHRDIVDALLSAGADVCGLDENGNSALHLACFYGNHNVVELLLTVDVDLTARDSEGRTPLDLATDPTVWRMVKTEEVVRQSGESFDLLAAVEMNDTNALGSFIEMGQEACGYPGNPGAIPLAAQRLRLDRQGRDGMTAVHLAAFHGYFDALKILLEAGADANAVCDDGETPLHTACVGGSTQCAIMLLEHGANPLATDNKGFVPCEKHVAAGRQDMKRLLEVKAFQATPVNLMALRADLAEVSLQIDAEEELFVRKGVAIKYLRKALKKKEADVSRLRQAVDSRDREIMNLSDRMDSVYRILSSGASRLE